MAGTQRLPTRITEITIALTKPSDQAQAWTSVINALQGQYGQGAWDGGIGADGYWVKYGYFFDCRLKITGSGSKTITMPFSCKDSILHITNTVTLASSVVYVNGSSATFTINNTSIVETFFNLVGK
jgi:hypothetical protein